LKISERKGIIVDGNKVKNVEIILGDMNYKKNFRI
jgi:hypothetical protein